MKRLLLTGLGLAMVATSPTGHAGTAMVTGDGKEAKEVKAPEPRFKIYGWIEAGVTYNHDDPNDHQNFGRLFDDRSNEPLLNQFVLTFERVLAPEPGQFDWGFKAQFMFGSDARFIHYFGEFDNTMHDIVQPDIVELYLNLHLPIFTEGGVDVKLGQFVTLEGAEVIDARANVFYSHSYIFNFGIPFKHTGILADWHVTKQVDIYGGWVRGVNAGWDDNNDAGSFHGGIGLNLNDGKFTVLASTSIGPENDASFELKKGFEFGKNVRYLNDVTAIWKITDKLTSITDLNFAYDDGASAEGYGVAQYLTYAISDSLSAGIRAEVWRDDDGFFVLQAGDNDDFVNLERGITKGTDPRTVGGGSTTYGAITAGLTFKPTMPKPLAGLMIRPEVRYDRALNGGSRPFNDSSDRDQLTAGIDVIVQF